MATDIINLPCVRETRRCVDPHAVNSEVRLSEWGETIAGSEPLTFKPLTLN